MTRGDFVAKRTVSSKYAADDFADAPAYANLVAYGVGFDEAIYGRNVTQQHTGGGAGTLIAARHECLENT